MCQDAQGNLRTKSMAFEGNVEHCGGEHEQALP